MPNDSGPLLEYRLSAFSGFYIRWDALPHLLKSLAPAMPNEAGAAARVPVIPLCGILSQDPLSRLLVLSGAPEAALLVGRRTSGGTLKRAMTAPVCPLAPPGAFRRARPRARRRPQYFWRFAPITFKPLTDSMFKIPSRASLCIPARQTPRSSSAAVILADPLSRLLVLSGAPDPALVVGRNTSGGTLKSRLLSYDRSRILSRASLWFPARQRPRSSSAGVLVADALSRLLVLSGAPDPVLVVGRRTSGGSLKSRLLSNDRSSQDPISRLLVLSCGSDAERVGRRFSTGYPPFSGF
ncbi:hypothetical protein DFH07DRAFT_965766 [Mycena maculata]|uniref:Uncharacterized protein n=1 Tax=Mycena maculata TaxID=230809 RepID=A0AAD7IDB0_9AGAR|nr:hypothetical protein DFH07DRAFT_965766 [Mycena maculata]